MAVIKQKKKDGYQPIPKDKIKHIKSTLDSENKWLFDYIKRLKEAY